MTGLITSGTAAAAGTRAGLTYLLRLWRRNVNDVGTLIWTDAEATALLDDFRSDYHRVLLQPLSALVGGSVVYQRYSSTLRNLEGSSSGTVAFRLHDSLGSLISTGWEADWARGSFLFEEDQRGSVRYIEARAFDLPAASAAGWRELAGTKAELYNFAADGGRFDRQQWFAHCLQMADYWDKQVSPSWVGIRRLDLVPTGGGDADFASW